MNFETLFTEITEWQKTTFNQATALSKAHHLEQEIYELLTVLEVGSEIEAREEFADCFMLLVGIAGAKGWSAEDIVSMVNDKLIINKNRKWGKPDENGVVRHIKPTTP